MTEVSIGLLIPISKTIPMGKQFEKAFKKAFKADNDLLDKGIEIEVVTEFIGNGGHGALDKAVNQLFGYHDVDIVVALMSNASIKGHEHLFAERKVPLILNNLGENIIHSNGYNEMVLVNSKHLWQHCMALGSFSANHFKGKGLLLSSFYETGYDFASSFGIGFTSEKTECTYTLSLIPPPNDAGLSHINAALNQIDFDEYKFIFPLLSNKEAKHFLVEFTRRGLHKKLGIVGLPFLLELEALDLPRFEIFTPVAESDIHSDPLMKNSFKVLGESVGKALRASIEESGIKNNPEDICIKMLDNSPNLIFRSTDIPCLRESICVLKNSVERNQVSFTSEFAKINLEIHGNQELKQYMDAEKGGWLNPYLTI